VTSKWTALPTSRIGSVARFLETRAGARFAAISIRGSGATQSPDHHKKPPLSVHQFDRFCSYRLAALAGGHSAKPLAAQDNSRRGRIRCVDLPRKVAYPMFHPSTTLGTTLLCLVVLARLAQSQLCCNRQVVGNTPILRLGSFMQISLTAVLSVISAKAAATVFFGINLRLRY